MRKTMFHYTSHIFTGDPSCSGKLKNFAQVIEGEIGSPDKPGGLSIQLCKSEKKEFYIRYSS